jgi:hypothetical protein
MSLEQGIEGSNPSSPAKLDLVDQFADLTADGLLPVGQGVDIGIDARVRDAM